MKSRPGRCGVLAALGLMCASACSGGASPVTPPVVNNTPPIIDSLSIAATRVEAGREYQLTASVRDTETPVDQLTYAWSASPAIGTFTGSSATATWRPPLGQTTPDVYTITLTVTERYFSAGQPQQNVVSRSLTIPYNDSRAEMIALGLQFIKDFGTFSVSPEECVRNFSDNCRGKQAEREDIENNRKNFEILSATMTPASVTFDTVQGKGVVEGPCVFIDIPKHGPLAGRQERVTGTCHLTTVYENFRWYLCDSFFNPPYSTTPLGLRGRVPGRLKLD